MPKSRSKDLEPRRADAPPNRDSEVERLKALLQKVQSDLIHERLERQACQRRATELESRLQEIALLNRRLASANAETAELMAAIEERNAHLKHANEQLARANAYAAELVALVETKEQEIRQLNQALALANAHAAELIVEREAQMEELERLNRRLNDEIQQRRRAEEEALRLTEELRIANADLDRLATLDPLTDLYNRRGLERLFDAEMSRALRTGDSIGVLFADFDDFKSVNERFGHAGGDWVLQECARRLRQSLRPSDPVARIGGDEFLALLPSVNEGSLRDVAERFRRSVSSQPVSVGKTETTLTMSVAAGILPPDVTDIEGILRWSREALKASKKRGKNRVTYIASATEEIGPG